MLDKVSPQLRHFLIGLLAAVLAAASQHIGDLNLNPAIGALVGAAIGYGLLWVTPLTKQYGVDSHKTDAPTEGDQS
jgi:hypothetical protein